LQPLLLSAACSANCLGAGVDATVTALQNGRGGLAPCRFDTVALQTFTGQVDGLEHVRMRPSLARYDCRNHRLAQLAMEQDGFSDAVAAARKRYGSQRIGVFVGTSTSGIFECERAYRNRDSETGALPPDFYFATTHDTSALADFVQRYLNLSGLAVTVSSACASTAKVFGNASRMIEAGLCDAAIVGGADSLCLTTLYGFNSLELVSAGACRPFDIGRDGISIGEAAGFVLLERVNDKPLQDDDILLLGYGESSDAHHMSHPHPDGLGARLAMERALARAKLAPQAIDYVNLHGTATKAGDASEDAAICAVFGTKTACSSTKGYLGHTLGAAGITEAIVTAAGIRYDFMPGGYNTSQLDPAVACHYLLASKPARVNAAMTNSFGFGGSNCSLILGRAA
jgi:3-oxoacyl-[acyl-carrier-protein] synthase-1